MVYDLYFLQFGVHFGQIDVDSHCRGDQDHIGPLYEIHEQGLRY